MLTLNALTDMESVCFNAALTPSGQVDLPGVLQSLSSSNEEERDPLRQEADLPECPRAACAGITLVFVNIILSPYKEHV